MKYDVQFVTPNANEALLDLVQSNIGRDPDSYTDTSGVRVAVWRCESQEEASQTEARVRGALIYTLGVQPVPEVSSGAIPFGGSDPAPNP